MQKFTNSLVGDLVFRVGIPESEVSSLFPKWREHALVLLVLRPQPTGQVIREAQEARDVLRHGRQRPVPKLLYLFRLRPPSMFIADAAPNLNLWLIELPLRQLEFESDLRGLIKHHIHVFDMLMDVCVPWKAESVPPWRS